MARAERRLVVAGVMTAPDGRVLLARRRPGTHLEGFWEFPGGGVEVGETPEEGLVRELSEELGVRVEVGAPLTFATHSDEAREIVLLFYRVSIVEGTPEGREGQDVRWFEPAALRTLRTPPADARLMSELGRGVPAAAANAEAREEWPGRSPRPGS